MSTTQHIDLADAVRGACVLPGDPRWDAARSSFNPLVDQRPAAVVFPEDADDVAAAVVHARRAGLRIAPQATGHNQAALGDLDGKLLLDVGRLQEVRVDPAARSVRVGAGVRWDQIVTRLSAYGLAGLHGSSPDVGIAGYSLGGGMGWLARTHGLHTNAVTAMELVTADGSIVRADAEHHADLFWALRGGGGNFGVVTAIEFGVQPVDELYAGALFFPFERSAEVLHAWSALHPHLPDEMMSWTSLLHFPPIPDVPAFARGRSFVIVMAAFLGEAREGEELLRPLRDLGPERDTFAMVPPIALANLAMDPYDPVPGHAGHQLLDGLPATAIEAVMAAAGPESESAGALTMLQFRQMGGALARELPGAGARATLPGEFSMFAFGVVLDEESDAAVRDTLAGVEEALAPHVAGQYPNLVEEPADARTFFDEDTWSRLREVKSRYDADGLFVGNHYVPPAD